MELSPASLAIFAAIWGAIWVIVGWWANHRFSSARDEKNARGARKQKFLSFMTKWESEILADSTTHHKVANDFVTRRHEFVAAAAEMELNYSGWHHEIFTDLVKAIRGLSPGQIDNEGCKELYGFVVGTITFVKKAN